MARQLFDFYLRKDQTPRQLLELAKENYHHPPLSAAGPGVVLATIPLSIDDFAVDSDCICNVCRNDAGLDFYQDKETKEIVCNQCIRLDSTDDPDDLEGDPHAGMMLENMEPTWSQKKKHLREIKERKNLGFFDGRQQPFSCDVCGEHPSVEDEQIFCCAIKNCKCDYNQCQDCATIIAAMDGDLEIFLPVEICNIVLDYLYRATSSSADQDQHLIWQKMKMAISARTSPTCPLVLRSRVLSTEELREEMYSRHPDKQLYENATDDCLNVLHEIEDVANEWLQESLTEDDRESYTIESVMIDWSSGFKIKLYYRDSFPRSIMIPTFASHIHEYSDTLRRHLLRQGTGGAGGGASEDGAYLGSISLLDYYRHTPEEKGAWEQDHEKIEYLLKECRQAFRCIKDSEELQRTLLPPFIDKEILDRLTIGEGERCMLVCLDVSPARKKREEEAKRSEKDKENRTE